MHLCNFFFKWHKNFYKYFNSYLTLLYNSPVSNLRQLLQWNQLLLVFLKKTVLKTIIKQYHHKQRYGSLFFSKITWWNHSFQCKFWEISALIRPYLKQYFQDTQKQPLRGVLKKRCSENKQQIYRRTLMPTCEITWVFPWKYAAHFQNIFVGTPLGDCFWATQSK